jgi:hypothetical protein
MSDTAETLRKGHNAELLLNNPTCSEALDEMATECTLGWLATQPDESGRREDLYQRARAIGDFREKLQVWFEEAAMEADLLERAEAKRKASEERNSRHRKPQE